MGLASASVDEAGAYSRPCTEPNRATEYKATTRAERKSVGVCAKIGTSEFIQTSRD